MNTCQPYYSHTFRSFHSWAYKRRVHFLFPLCFFFFCFNTPLWCFPFVGMKHECLRSALRMRTTNIYTTLGTARQAGTHEADPHVLCLSNTRPPDTRRQAGTHGADSHVLRPPDTRPPGTRRHAGTRGADPGVLRLLFTHDATLRTWSPRAKVGHA